jgi:uncharacterized protein YbjT (DUF2867 family)
MTVPVPSDVRKRRVVLAGATGLVGGHLLQGLLADESVAQVHVVGRRPLAFQHSKLGMHVVEFASLPPLPAVDEVYLSLGTTIRTAGSREAFRALDFDANLAVAQAALRSGARRIGLVSAMGADAHSSIFYNRVKGELEEAILALAAEAVVIVRPSLLLGDRKSLGQEKRPGETVAKVLMSALSLVIPGSYRAIRADKVAAALLRTLPSATGAKILGSAELQSH